MYAVIRKSTRTGRAAKVSQILARSVLKFYPKKVTGSGPKIPAADQLRRELLLGFGISTSLEDPTVSTLLEHPKYGCSNEVLFLAFLALEMAFKVNFDPVIGFLVSHMSSMPSFRCFGGLIWP